MSFSDRRKRRRDDSEGRGVERKCFPLQVTGAEISDQMPFTSPTSVEDIHIQPPTNVAPFYVCSQTSVMLSAHVEQK